ncbi:MAG: arginine--tRNA ligase [Blastocatellia bacterium]|nr:arginine--tRNA ligase [Blastocatellia bacterium]
MLESLRERLVARLRECVRERFDLALEEVPIEIPPQVEYGDLAFPIAFQLARKLRERTGQTSNPRALAEMIAAHLPPMEEIARVEVAGAGYINVFLNRGALLVGLRQPEPPREPSGEKIIVEHTSINPNKAAHIGHLRNAVLGDALVRLLRYNGARVEVHNYIDNTGVQVADVVVGFKYLEKKDRAEIEAIPGKFDHYCWDLYARVTAWYEEDPTALELRRRTLSEIEEGGNPTAELAEYISMRVLNAQLDTVERLGIYYDLLPRESEILHLRFWDRAFELLKAAGLITYETEGKNRGCWVMRLPSESESEAQGEEGKVLVRSDGTVVYTGKDIAYHLWKLGRLDVDFSYRPFRRYSNGHTTWITTTEGASEAHPEFGHGSAYLSVIGSEQTYLQKFVKEAVRALVVDPRVERSAHIAYEKVALTPRACLELGIELSPEELERQQISMSGRRGLGVKADDLIEKLEEKALSEVRARHPERSEAEARQLAHQIAVGALRYFLLKYTRTTAIAFDFAEALAFEGETGPYIQYAVVRARSIFRKLREAGIERRSLGSEDLAEINRFLNAHDDLWTLLYFAARLREFVRQACENYEPAILAKYAFQLAQRFNNFYHSYHILSEDDPLKREIYLTITEIVCERLTRALDLLGIEVPEQM